MTVAYYNENVRCYSNGKIERLDKRLKNPVWKEVSPTSFNSDGYLLINIDGKNMKWHRVIWVAFNGKIPDGLQINHIDENKANNSLENLELVTCKENINHGTRNERAGKSIAKANTNHPLKSKKVICIETGIIYDSIHEAERQTGIYQTSICQCCLGRYKTSGGYHWSYV